MVKKIDVIREIHFEFYMEYTQNRAIWANCPVSRLLHKELEKRQPD